MPSTTPSRPTSWPPDTAADTRRKLPAKARVAAFGPTLEGPTFDGLCAQAGGDCITERINEVTARGDVFCTFCEGCDCATDRFSTCVGKCTSP